ncbi:hypothetical protein GCM10009087_18270 [Sphingomonas oligophenolica]|uniref:DUF4402 domain-containing protein n=1 Tax=Sphingomonas oligophenolica TaxID=301154 RepID=A0ABU9Y3H1_9SPHN
MSGVIGAVSNKFILITATLILPVTINGHTAHGAIDPALKDTVVSPRFAARLHLGNEAAPLKGTVAKLRRPLTIGIGAENFDIDTVEIGRDQCCADRDFVIGRDILAAHVFEIDFVHRTIRLVLPFEYRRATQHLQSIALMQGPDGSRMLPIQVGDSPAVEAVLDLADPGALKVDRATLSATHSLSAGEPRPVRSGDATIGNLELGLADGKQRLAPAAIGMGAFAGSRIILDLPHDQLWVARKS